MSARIASEYTAHIARALATQGGHLGIGRGGFTLHYDNSRLSGYDCDVIKEVAVAAGLPVIDSRMVPFEVAAKLAVNGPMIAVNAEPSPRPWHALAYASLAAVAAAYRKAGADVINVPEHPDHDGCFEAMPPGPAATLIDSWLNHVRVHGSRSTPMTNLAYNEYEAKYEAQRKLQAELLPRNKVALFNVLAAAGIATVTVEFEGSGDSGQMEKPCARAADETIVELPPEPVELERMDWTHGLQKEHLALSDAVEAMAWRLLGETHGGWENDDGGYGEFTFDVAERSITLEYSERYTETNYHEHTF